MMNDEEIKQGNNGNIGNNDNNGIINYQMPQVNQAIWVIQVTWEKKDFRTKITSNYTGKLVVAKKDFFGNKMYSM